MTDNNIIILQPGVSIKPQVSPEKVKEIVKNQYGLNCIFLKQLNGYDDINYFVAVDGTNENENFIEEVCPAGYILKVVNSLDSKKTECFDAQNQILLHLGRQDTICPKPTRNKDGEHYFIDDFPSGKHLVRLLEFIEGTILYQIDCSNDLFFQCGQYIANLDKNLKNFRHSALDNFQSIWILNSVPQLEEFLFAIKDETKQLLVKEVLQEFCNRVVPMIPSLERGMIHGDFNEQNILVRKEEERWQVKAILDFGDCHYGYYLFEIAIALTYMILQGKKLEVGGYVLAGYESVKKIPEKEFNLLKICVAGRLCQSLVLGAYSNLQDPNNSYILVSAQPGWILLEKLWKQPENELLSQWKEIIKTIQNH